MISLCTQFFLSEEAEPEVEHEQDPPQASGRFTMLSLAELFELTDDERKKMIFWDSTIIAAVGAIAIYVFQEKVTK